MLYKWHQLSTIISFCLLKNDLLTYISRSLVYLFSFSRFESLTIHLLLYPFLSLSVLSSVISLTLVGWSYFSFFSFWSAYDIWIAIVWLLPVHVILSQLWKCLLYQTGMVPRYWPLYQKRTSAHLCRKSCTEAGRSLRGQHTSSRTLNSKCEKQRTQRRRKGPEKDLPSLHKDLLFAIC